MVKASIQEVETVSVAVPGEAERLAVAQGCTVEAIERGEAVGVQAADVAGVAH